MTDVRTTALVARDVTGAKDGAAVRGISLDVEAGECVGVSGSEIANASLLLRVLATLVRPVSGSVRVHGVDALNDPFAARPRIAFAGGRGSMAGAFDAADCGGLDPRLTVLEQLRYMLLARRTAAVNGENGDDAVDLVLARIGVTADRAVESLAPYEHALVVLASCLLGRPEVLLVEEPLGGFGVATAGALALVAEARSHGAAVLLATADRAMWDRACSRWLWLDEEGRCRTHA